MAVERAAIEPVLPPALVPAVKAKDCTSPCIPEEPPEAFARARAVATKACLACGVGAAFTRARSATTSGLLDCAKALGSWSPTRTAGPPAKAIEPRIAAPNMVLRLYVLMLSAPQGPGSQSPIFAGPFQAHLRPCHAGFGIAPAVRCRTGNLKGKMGLS